MRPLLLALLGVGSPARAHPFDASFHGHQLEVELDGPTLRVGYAVEVPTLSALADLERFLEGVENPGPEHQRAYTERILDELHGGLVVQVDGQRVAMDRLEPVSESGVGDRRFITFRVLGEGALPPDATTVHVVNANFPGEPGLFSTVVRVDDAVRVDDSDLLRWSDDQVVGNDVGRWLAGEEQREVRVAFRRADPLRAWWRSRERRWVEPEGPRLRPLRAAVTRDPPGLLERATPSGATAGTLAAAALPASLEVGPGAAFVGLGAGALGAGRMAVALAVGLGALCLLGAGWGPATQGWVPSAALLVSAGLAVAIGRRSLGLAFAFAASALPASGALDLAFETVARGGHLGSALTGAAALAGLMPGLLGLLGGALLLRGRPGIGRPLIIIGLVLILLGRGFALG